MRRPKGSASEEDNPLLVSSRGRKYLSASSPLGISDDNDKNKDFPKTSAHHILKKRLNAFFENPTVDFTLKTINGIFSLILVIQYIYALYVPDPFTDLWWGLMSFLIHLYLFGEYLFRLYAAKDTKKYFMSEESGIDLISNVPFLIIRLITADPLSDDPSSIILRIGNVMSILRLLRLESYQTSIDNEVNRQLTNITLTILTLILFASAGLQIVQNIHSQYVVPDNIAERDKVHYSYQFYVFSIIITISTLGYENNFPGAITKIFLIILISVSLSIIPTKSSQLISIFSSKSVYARLKYKTTEHIQHIIVTGAVSNEAALNFFKEFFHEDHGNQGRHGILLLPNAPDSVMETMIRKEFANNIHYIQYDSQVKESDLKRCQAEKAKAIIILCNKQSSDATQEDSTTILQAMFIKKYLRHAKAPNVKVCMQILRPEGKMHYYLSNKQTSSDQVLCVEEFKLSLLAKSCLCPGLIALVSNLISSSGDPPKRAESDNEWLDDYWHGKGYEVYKVNLSSQFHGQKFSWVAAKIYKKFKAILFALELSSSDNARMYNNPGDYILPRGTRVTAYVISPDKQIADDISDYKTTPEDLDFARKFLRKSSSFLKRAAKTPRASVKASTAPNLGEKNNSGDEKSDGEDEEEVAAQFSTKLKQENFNNQLSGEYINLEDGFHLSSAKTNLIDVSFKTMENNRLAHNHIILCGIVSDLRRFVLPLRAKYLEKYLPIVILHVSPPTEKQWNPISYFPEIYFVKGSAMNVKDLLRANIKQAARVVILSPEIEEVKNFASGEVRDPKNKDMNSKRLTRDQEDLLDAKTVFKYKAVNKLRPDISIITELVSPQNLGFLINNSKDYGIMKKYDHINTPIFASGAVYLSSMIDNLICQAYYNPSLITVLNQLIVGSGGTKQKSNSTEIIGSNLYPFDIPKAFVGETFGKIFEYLSKVQNIIPIALYRKSGVKGNKIPYVVTNPDSETILTEKDALFILSQKSPPASSVDWGAPFEYLGNDELRDGHIATVVRAVHGQEVAMNYEEQGKENRRHKKLEEEKDSAMKKIKEMVADLKKAREEIESLKDDLEARQKKVLFSLRKVISGQIASILPAEATERRAVYDDDDMLTASPASSISQS